MAILNALQYNYITNSIPNNKELINVHISNIHHTVVLPCAV